MPTFVSSKKLSLKAACREILSLIDEHSPFLEHGTFCFELNDIDEELFLTAASGTVRIAYKSRDQDILFLGLGVADKISHESPLAALSEAHARAKVNIPGHIYLGASKFDAELPCSVLWRDFPQATYILPLLLITKTETSCLLNVNFRYNNWSWPLWCDFVKTLLLALIHALPVCKKNIYAKFICSTPSLEGYRYNVDSAIKAIHNGDMRKVVLGRQRCLNLNDCPDAAILFNRLKQSSPHAFLFFYDLGLGSSFFGASPELLYRKRENLIETESLAGTRARSLDKIKDNELSEELLLSTKDNQEHWLVSQHIEDVLKGFAIEEIKTEELSIMMLPYVQHLVRRYRGFIHRTVSDSALINALHPTPAVCGFNTKAALNFIRNYEGFDRGLYAGYIGYLRGQDIEFSVSIRSALYSDRCLYTFAAGGIVASSHSYAEWIELDNKEKNILSIFDEEIQDNHEAQ